MTSAEPESGISVCQVLGERGLPLSYRCEHSDVVHSIPGGRDGTDDCVLPFALPPLPPAPNNRNVYVCTVSAFPAHFYDTVFHCLPSSPSDPRVRPVT